MGFKNRHKTLYNISNPSIIGAHSSQKKQWTILDGGEFGNVLHCRTAMMLYRFGTSYLHGASQIGLCIAGLLYKSITSKHLIHIHIQFLYPVLAVHESYKHSTKIKDILVYYFFVVTMLCQLGHVIQTFKVCSQTCTSFFT